MKTYNVLEIITQSFQINFIQVITPERDGTYGKCDGTV